MGLDLLRRLAMFIGLCLAQTLVLNHIHLFGCATPLLYIYMVVLFPRNYPRWGMLLWSFLLGLSIDIFSNTPGVAATAMTTTAFLQPYLLTPFLQRETPAELKPAMTSMGLARFSYFTVLIVFVYCILLFSIEAFNFFNWLQWIESIVGSTALTVLLILVIENVRR